MTELDQQVPAVDDGTPLSDTPAEEQPAAEIPVAADTTETEAETDEQKNERELKEQKDRSEKRARGIQKRLDELTADKYSERQAREATERTNQQLMALLQNRAPQTVQNDPNQEPKRDQFSDYEEYLRAVGRHESRQTAIAAINQQQQEWQRQQQQQVLQAQMQQVQQEFGRRLAEGRAKIPDFEEVIADAADIETGNAESAILTSDNPAALIHYLGKNPKVAARLAALPPIVAAREIGKIEVTLAGTPQVSKAPSPGKPVGSKPGPSSEPPEDTGAYMAWAAKNMR